MSLLFNVTRAKCIKIIFPMAKHILTNNKQRTITLPNAKRSFLDSMKCSWPNHKNAAESVIFGFSLLGVIGLVEDDTNRQLIDTIKKGIVFFQNGDYDAFEQTLNEALKIALDLNSDRGITQVYNVLANGAFMNKEYEKANDLFTEIIGRLIDQGCLNDDLNILQFGLQISQIYEIQKDYKYSEYGYKYCLQLLEKKLTTDPENKDILDLYAQTLTAYGRFLLIQKEENKLAKVNLKKAYKISVKLHGEMIRNNVILLNALGIVYYAERNLNKAIVYLKKAKKIQNIQSLSMVYINLGRSYLYLGMLEKAEKNCEKALQLAKRHGHFICKKEAERSLVQIYNAMKKRRVSKERKKAKEALKAKKAKKRVVKQKTSRQ